MKVLFTHCCPFCQRRRRMDVNILGQQVQCVQCGKVAIATDPHSESLALMDCIKQHAELAQPVEDVPSRIRAPR